MKFLLNESADARLAPCLTSLGYDVTLVARDYQAGIPDHEVLRLAHREGRILITDDRDFGDLVFRQRQAHAGVIYFRLASPHIALRLAPGRGPRRVFRPTRPVSRGHRTRHSHPGCLTGLFAA
jgi:hypothetical protein